MENIILEIMGKNSDAEVFNYEKGDIVVFINLSAIIHGFYDYETIRESFFKIREYIKRYLGFYVSGTISPILTGVTELSGVLSICEDTLRCRTGIAELFPYNEGQRNEIALAKEYILNHLGERLGIRETAAHVGKSESYFSHLFKKETGTSFVDYVNRVKMDAAAELLEDSSLKTVDVAERLGIDNPNYFSVLFKKIMGSSPLEYRNKKRKS
jgi:AraC-like DNA-binding protein